MRPLKVNVMSQPRNHVLLGLCKSSGGSARKILSIIDGAKSVAELPDLLEKLQSLVPALQATGATTRWTCDLGPFRYHHCISSCADLYLRLFAFLPARLSYLPDAAFSLSISASSSFVRPSYPFVVLLRTCSGVRCLSIFALIR